MKYGDKVYVVWDTEWDCAAGTDEDMKMIYINEAAAKCAVSLDPGRYEIHECVITRKQND